VVGAVRLNFEKGGKVEGCGELCFFCYSFFLLRLRQGTRIGELELEVHDALQVPEDSVWLSNLVISRSRRVPLLLKLAYNGCPLILEQRKLELRRRKGEVGKLRTARGQIIGPCHCKGAVGFGGDIVWFRRPDDRIQELAARMMDEVVGRVLNRSLFKIRGSLN